MTLALILVLWLFFIVTPLGVFWFVLYRGTASHLAELQVESSSIDALALFLTPLAGGHVAKQTTARIVAAGGAEESPANERFQYTTQEPMERENHLEVTAATKNPTQDEDKPILLKRLKNFSGGNALHRGNRRKAATHVTGENQRDDSGMGSDNDLNNATVTTLAGSMRRHRKRLASGTEPSGGAPTRRVDPHVIRRRLQLMGSRGRLKRILRRRKQQVLRSIALQQHKTP